MVVEQKKNVCVKELPRREGFTNYGKRQFFIRMQKKEHGFGLPQKILYMIISFGKSLTEEKIHNTLEDAKIAFAIEVYI